MASMFDFFGGGTGGAAAPGVAPDSDGGGLWDWMSDPKNKTSLVAMLGGAAKAVDPQGQTTGGQLGSAISGMATSKISADKAAQQAAELKAAQAKAEAEKASFMQRLGLTPPDQPGPTKVSFAKGNNGELTTTTTETPFPSVKKPSIPSAFGGGGASNFP